VTKVEPLAPGAVVVYHGSLTEMHGTYTVVRLCGSLEHCERCDAFLDELWEPWYWSLNRRDQARAGDLFDRQYGHVWPRYELISESGERLLCVRRSSITPTSQAEGQDA
jgi:hypothetical protein